ncbi:MAG: sugar transporter permease [Paenibacillus sp.]|nr:sugar transporter permease [Paenibacillus sp.]
MIGKRLRSDTLALWIIVLPGVLYFIIFKYVPMLGNVIAFKNYGLFLGIVKSPWVGLQYFEMMFSYDLPHFLSWVIVGGIFINLLSMNGFFNMLLDQAGMGPIDFLSKSEYFKTIIISTGIWKEVGWGMIIYLAALAGVNPSLYEAAMVDGAGRWRRMWSITLPAIMPAIVVLFLLRISSALDANVEQILVFLNPLVFDKGEVIDTYVYRIGLLGSQFSYSTAIGLFKSLIGLVLVVGLNQLSKRTTGESIY